ncbi:MAG: hypothetical protein JXO44_15145 [Clostridia bacterium]|nr:hypothetical protein [Clostridia bacterium]
MDAGEYSLQDIADAINAAGSGSAGTFGSDIAVVDSGTIKLRSQSTGADSIINVTAAGGFSGIFDAAKDGAGADTSIKLTLTIDGTETIVQSGIAPTATSVTFTESGGATATFTLAGNINLDNIDISDEFSASSITREVTGIDISSRDAASSAITVINNALTTVSTERSKLGAIQNRLEHTIANLDTSAENLQASESRIRDVDMAKEMMEFTKNNILQQAAQSMLAQANQAPQGVLQLLR